MRAQASAKVWAGRVLACGHGRKPLGPECEKVRHQWRRRRGRGQHGSGHDRKARRNARACRERPGDHQQTLCQQQLHSQHGRLSRFRRGSANTALTNTAPREQFRLGVVALVAQGCHT